MDIRKIVALAVTAVFILVAFFAVERISFFKGNPLFEGTPVKVVNGLAEAEDVLAAKCKGDRGENEVLEIVRNGNVSYARCGMFWPFTDIYVMSTETPR